MNVLLLGADGQLGQTIQASMPVQAVSRQQADLSDPAQLHDIVHQSKPDYVVLAAAYTAVDRAESEPEIAAAVNTKGPYHVAVACKKLNTPLIYISTDYVFNGTGQRPYTETDPVSPLGVYGQSKWGGEEVVRQLLPKHLILRVSWLFSQYRANFVKTMLRLAQERDELKVVADQFGTPTSTQYVAHTIQTILSRWQSGDTNWGTFHCAGQQVVSWYDFACAIVDEARAQGLPVRAQQVHPISTADYPTPARRPAYSALDSTLLQQTWGLPAHDWRQALKDVIAAEARQ